MKINRKYIILISDIDETIVKSTFSESFVHTCSVEITTTSGTNKLKKEFYHNNCSSLEIEDKERVRKEFEEYIESQLVGEYSDKNE